MSKNKIVLKNSLPLILSDGCNFEALISQIQPYMEDSILAVKNGEELVIFKKIDEIPKDFSQEGKKRFNVSYFRSKKNGDLYSFFGDDVFRIIKNRINKQKIPKDTITKDGKIQKATHSMDKRAFLNIKIIDY